MSSPLRIAIMTTEARGTYGPANAPLSFGTAPQALIDGFAMLPDIQQVSKHPSEVPYSVSSLQHPPFDLHIISCNPVRVPQVVSKLADNITHHSVFVPSWAWLKTGYLGCILGVRKLLKALRPDILHGQGTERDCAMCTTFSGRPNVLTIHGNMSVHANRSETSGIYYKIAAFLESVCLKRTDGVIAISRYTDSLVSPLAKRTWFLPNPVDPSFFDISVSQPITPRILFVGGLCERKNPFGLLETVAHFLEKKMCTLAFAGTGDANGAYCRRFDRLADSLPGVERLGFLDRERLMIEFSRSSILVLPTFEDNCPMVVLEAQAAGLPVAASDVGGIPDLITHGTTGLLFDPARPETMRECIEQLLSNPGLRDHLGKQGKAHALSTYHPAVVAQKHLEIYREVLMEKERQLLK